HNRAIAFGSLILAGAGGRVDDWKEIRAYGWCDDIIVEPDPNRPIPFPGDGSDSGAGDGDDDDASKPGTSCSWSVMYTTDYRIEICPNGRAWLLRTGEGVNVVSRHEGETFEWTEGVWCDDGPTLADAVDPLDPRRPLDLRRLQRKPLR